MALCTDAVNDILEWGLSGCPLKRTELELADESSGVGMF